MLQMTRTVRRRLGIMGLLPAGVASAMAVASAGTMQQAIRATDGTAACLISSAPDSSQGLHQLAVQVRAPGTPSATVTDSLPTDLRDFSTLPIRVILLSPSSSGPAPSQRLPVSLDATLEHPVIDGAPSADGFVRAIFPRDWVVAGVTILGERMVVAPGGAKVTSQTRCAITANDVAQWR